MLDVLVSSPRRDNFLLYFDQMLLRFITSSSVDFHFEDDSFTPKIFSKTLRKRRKKYIITITELIIEEHKENYSLKMYKILSQK